MTGKEIIALLPYTEPFLFVDEIETVTEKGIKGHYNFTDKAFFYKGHFKNNPITPGVILTECMAQIGLVSLGIYLLKDHKDLTDLKVAFTSSEVDFIEIVYPNTKVTVISEIQYFRFNKLKCKIKLYNASDKLVCQGVLAGMITL
jgi:3-hydroxyacyl-[acyl-carrier-protein] dehydratase